MLVTNVLPKPVYVKQPSRKCSQYSKADWAKLTESADDISVRLCQEYAEHVDVHGVGCVLYRTIVSN